MRSPSLFPVNHTGLLWQLLVRDLKERYRAHTLGWLWALLTPLLMLLVYTWVMRHVLGVRWAGEAVPQGLMQADQGWQWQADLAYAARLFSGLVIFNYTAECLGKAPRLIVNVPHLVKKVVFPLELLPWISCLSGVLQLFISMLLLVIASLVTGVNAGVQLLWLPVIWLALLPLLLAVSTVVAAIGVFLRDVGELMGPAIGALMFLSPIFYESTRLSEPLRTILSLNPLTPIIESTRAVLIHGLSPDPAPLVLVFTAGVIVQVLAGGFFSKVRPGFADAL